MKHAFLSLFPLSHRFEIERDDVSPRPGEELRGERDVVDRVSRLVVVAFRELRTRDADEEERKEEKEDASAAGAFFGPTSERMVSVLSTFTSFENRY